MFAGTPVITETGKTLLLRAASGETFTFTKFQVGSGFLEDSETPETMTQLKRVVIANVPITQAQDTEQSGYIQLHGRFDNYTNVSADFRWRELGLIAEDEDHNEYLYAYGYEDEYSDLVKAGGTDVIVEQQFSVIIAVGSTNNITAYVIPNMQYPTLEQFNEHVNNKSNPHEVTLEQLEGARADHTHSTSDIQSGVLGVERGGTGVTNYEDLSRQLSANYKIGFYVGDGKTRHVIQLDFAPSKVIIFPLNQGSEYQTGLLPYYIEPGKNVYHSGCGSQYYTSDVESMLDRGHGGAGIDGDKLKVGWYNASSNYPQTNAANKMYMYIAFRQED